MTAPKPDVVGGPGVMGLLRMVAEHARPLAAELRAEAADLRKRADEQDRQALSLDQMQAIVEAHVPMDRQANLELQRSA